MKKRDLKKYREILVEGWGQGKTVADVLALPHRCLVTMRKWQCPQCRALQQIENVDHRVHRKLYKGPMELEEAYFIIKLIKKEIKNGNHKAVL